MGCLDLCNWKDQLSKLDAWDFSVLYRELRERNGTAAFNDAFFEPERLTDEEVRKFGELFADHGISLKLERQFEVRDVFLIVMAEAIDRSMRNP